MSAAGSAATGSAARPVTTEGAVTGRAGGGSVATSGLAVEATSDLIGSAVFGAGTARPLSTGEALIPDVVTRAGMASGTEAATGSGVRAGRLSTEDVPVAREGRAALG